MKNVLVNSTKAGTMMNELVVDEFLQGSILVPTIAEQTRIGTIMSALDNLITLHQRKYDKLQVVKKAMLEKMFPKNGSNVPEIRFRGFTDTWEQRKLGEVSDSYSGGTPTVGVKEYYDGQIPYNGRMDKQMTISAFSDELAQVRTKKKEFLAQIERIVPWKEWIAMIQPCYYKGERGNKPYPLERMVRLYLLQNLYDLSDEATAAEAIDSRAFSDFCGIDSSNQVPDGDTLGRFRNLLIKNGLQEKLFAQVVAALMERGLILKKGTIVDSTIISAPSSTKNKEKKRDPDAHQVKKGNTWHFGYKAHIGVDKDSGLVHTVEATSANVHDVAETSKLLTGEEEAVYGDSGYLGAEKRDDAIIRNEAGHKIKYRINRRPSQVKKLSKSGQYAAKKAEHAKSSVRAKVEHVFGVVKKQLRFRKTRYRGLEKQRAKFNIMFALANLILADRPCLAA